MPLAFTQLLWHAVSSGTMRPIGHAGKFLLSCFPLAPEPVLRFSLPAKIDSCYGNASVIDAEAEHVPMHTAPPFNPDAAAVLVTKPPVLVTVARTL
jgi:hypothetical protein